MCHICLTAYADSMIKCKLCCDGWEQDTCTECTKLYHEYKRAISALDISLTEAKFEALKLKRNEGIAKQRARAKHV